MGGAEARRSEAEDEDRGRMEVRKMEDEEAGAKQGREREFHLVSAAMFEV